MNDFALSQKAAKSKVDVQIDSLYFDHFRPQWQFLRRARNELPDSSGTDIIERFEKLNEDWNKIVCTQTASVHDVGNFQ